VIVEMGVEGGGVTIYGRQVEGVWSFWREGISLCLDENEDEDWRSWTSDPVSDLSLALSDKWYMMSPIEVHPDFVAQLRSEYERCRETQTSGGCMTGFRHERWRELLAEPSQDT